MGINKIYIKDFTTWNRNKIKIDEAESRPLVFKNGQIWWVSCGINIGTEIDGKGDKFLRPFLIIKKNDTRSAICLPMSSFKNKKRAYYFETEINNTQVLFVLSQIKNIDSKRFYKYHCEISEKKLEIIKEALILYIKSPNFH